MAAKKKIDPRKELGKEINEFVTSLKGRSKASREEIKKMFDLYNKWYTTKETNYSCDLCAIRIYSKLEKISKDYESGKRIR